jgi:hypothetical protein
MSDGSLKRIKYRAPIVSKVAIIRNPVHLITYLHQ